MALPMSIDNAAFLKSLTKHYLQRRQIKHDLIFLRYLIKVSKWRKEIKKQTIEVSKKNKAIRDNDTARLNLWLMIVRKDVIQAHQRRREFQEVKVIKTRLIARQCQSKVKSQSCESDELSSTPSSLLSSSSPSPSSTPSSSSCVVAS